MSGRAPARVLLPNRDGGRRVKGNVLIFAGWLLAAAPAWSESLTMEGVVAQAMASGPAPARVERDYQVTLADGVAATTLDNPEIGVDALRATQGAATSGVGLSVVQPLKLSQLDGKRALYAEALGAAATAEQRYETFRTIRDVSNLYVRLWLLQEKKKLYTSFARDAEALSAVVGRSAGGGQTPAADAALFRADTARFTTEVAAAEAEAGQARAELARLANRDLADASLERPSFSPVPDAAALLAFSQGRATLRSVVSSSLSAAERRKEVADQDGTLPDFGPRLFYSGAPGERRYAGIGVGLRIPLWNHNDAERRRADAELAYARARASSLPVTRPETLIGQLRDSAAMSQARAESYWGDIMPAYRRSYKLSRDMLKAGQINALSLWQVREKYYQVQETALQAVADAYAARTALENEIGGKLEEAL